MKFSRGFFATFIIALLLILPLSTYLVMKKGYDVRKSTQPSKYFTNSSVKIPAYNSISQRGDTITDSAMRGKVCVYEFFNDTCIEKDYPGRHPLFDLQEDYYGRTRLLRFISVFSHPERATGSSLNYFSSRFAAREIWHFVITDSASARHLENGFVNTLTSERKNEGNYSCNETVFLVDKKGMIKGNYFISDKEQFSALYNDILYLIDKDL